MNVQSVPLNNRGVAPIIALVVIVTFIVVGASALTLNRNVKPTISSDQVPRNKNLKIGTFSTVGEAPSVAGEVIVKFKSNISIQTKPITNANIKVANVASIDNTLPETTQQVLKAVGAKKIYPVFTDASNKSRFRNVYRVTIPLETDPAEAARIMSADPNIEYAERNVLMHIDETPNDPQYGQQWEWPILEAPAAWDKNRGSKSITVAVIDTGIDFNHPELKDSLVEGKNFLSPGGSANDDNGHGTHVAGTIGAIGNNNTGVVGVNWNVSLMPLKVCNAAGTCPDDATAAALTYAADHGAKVVNMSLGGPGTPPQLLKEAMTYAASKGVFLAVAAGNSNADAGTHYPAMLPESFTVAATDSSDGKASFSNWGKRIDIAAPGVGIFSTHKDGQYKVLSGTSMATPHVAGLAALMLSVRPSLTRTQLADLMQKSADDIGAPGKDDYFGAGRINMRKAVIAAETGVAPSGSPVPSTSPSGSPSSPKPPAYPNPTIIATVTPVMPSPTASDKMLVPPSNRLVIPNPSCPYQRDYATCVPNDYNWYLPRGSGREFTKCARAPDGMFECW